MVLKVEHIGIAVRDLHTADQLYQRLLGVPPYKHEEVPTEAVKTSFFQAGDTKIELLEATAPHSAIARYIEKHGEGIHHIAFEVADIYTEMSRLRQEGFQLLSDNPKPGADNKLVTFIHPRTAHGVLVELCQERTDTPNHSSQQ